jgi:hypothetical protein
VDDVSRRPGCGGPARIGRYLRPSAMPTFGYSGGRSCLVCRWEPAVCWSSSRRCDLAVGLTPRSRRRVDQRCDGRVAAQLVQAAAAVGANAADRDAEPDIDLGIRRGRILGEQGDQLLAAGWQLRERLAQGCVALGREQLLLGRLGVIVRDALGVRRIAGIACSRRGAQDAVAFPPGRDG